MAKKKSVGGIIFLMFLRSFIVVILMLVIGMASYTVTMKFYEVSESDTAEENKLDIVGDVTADAVSRNIIYSVNSETSRIDAVLVEILNTQTNNLDYITIPDTLQITISNEMYQRMYAAGADVPQIMQFAKLNDYFKDNTAYEYGILILEDYLGIDIGYYTRIDSNVFKGYYSKAAHNDWYVVNDTLLQEAGAATDETAMNEFIKNKYSSLESNIDLKTKQKYAESYLEVDPKMIYYHILDGKYDNSVFLADPKECKKSYQTILMEPAHTSVQGDIANIRSEGLNIKVLNGSGGDNIATATKEKLAGDGLNVVKIADNPDGVIDKTMIYVTEDGMGRDLLYYFKDASIEVKELDEGIDILIIVGASDADIGQRE